MGGPSIIIQVLTKIQEGGRNVRVRERRRCYLLVLKVEGKVVREGTQAGNKFFLRASKRNMVTLTAHFQSSKSHATLAASVNWMLFFVVSSH